MALLPALAWLSAPDAKNSVSGGATVAIVVVQDDPAAEARLAAYRSAAGLPACTSANGCFAKVNQAGRPSPLPVTVPAGGDTAEHDLERASALCPACKILVVEAASSDMTDLAMARSAALARGAAVVDDGGELALDYEAASTGGAFDVR